MKIKLLCLLLFFISFLQAAVVCKGIVLLKPEEPLLSLEKVHEIEGISNRLKTPSSYLLEDLLKTQFLGRSIDAPMTQELRCAIQSAYEQKNRPVTTVVIPEQEVADGVIQVRICESRVENVDVEGGDHTSKQLLLHYLGVKKDDPIDTSKLKDNLDFMNRNPFRRVDLIYSPGKSPNTTDLSLLVEDRYPLRVYVGTDDTGVETTDRGRFITGAQWARAFGLDHFFAYQYTSSYDFHRFQAHTAQYIAYFSWKHILNVYGGYSNLYADLPAPSTRNHGQSYQASGRYIIPLPALEYLSHETSFGFDFKRTNNTIEFAETTPTVGPNVNLSQFMVRYAGDLKDDRHHFAFEGELYFSPGPVMGDESNAAYSALREDAKNHWVYGRALLKYFQKLPHACYLNLTARGQLSSQNLLPSEQLGLGGFDSVRGYDERQLNFDSGCILNAEFLTPSVLVFGNWGKKSKKWKDAFQLLGFVDYGYGSNHNKVGTEDKKDHLLGIGPGVRYTLDPWITARLDLGIKLRRDPTFTGGSAMWYFSFVASL